MKLLKNLRRRRLLDSAAGKPWISFVPDVRAEVLGLGHRERGHRPCQAAVDLHHRDDVAAHDLADDVRRLAGMITGWRARYDRGEIDEDGNPKMPFGSGFGLSTTGRWSRFATVSAREAPTATLP